jgi:hypothetical protein
MQNDIPQASVIGETIACLYPHQHVTQYPGNRYIKGCEKPQVIKAVPLVQERIFSPEDR